MISNPVTVHTWNKIEKFTYEGGSQLFHFSPYDNKLSRALECNVIFFAHDKVHAKDVLKRMFEFVIKGLENKSTTHREVLAMHERRYNQFKSYLENIDDIKLSMAPTDQFYEVGWAGNDTVI